MNQEQRSLLLNSLPSHPAASYQGGKVIYGARGFSGDASLLQPTAFKAGILAALRSLKSQSVIGLMITASVDVEGSAGVRIIDPDGRMLTSKWKPFADSVVNVGDPDDFVALIDKLVIEENISLQSGQPAEIWVGRSSTPNGESLSHSAKQGISSIVGAVVHDKGVLTAPQLHWLVRAKNEGLKSSEQDYFDLLSASYRCLADMIPRKTTSENTSQKLVVYGADGVGGDKLEVLKQLCNGLEMDIQSSGGGDCTASGINFVERVKIFASGFGPGNVEHRFASFDADAERLVYLFPRLSQNEIDVVHRDKVLSLFAFFIREQLNILDDDENQQPDSHCYSHLGIFQNTSVGEASAAFLKSLGFSLVLLPDGVECLHEEAAKYDIGICATEDGRWTILFSERILSWLESENKDLSSTPGGSRRQKAASQLLAMSTLMNHATSDALGGLLLVEAILRYMGWSVTQWNDLHDPNTELDVVAVENSGIRGTDVTSLDDLSRCQEAIEHGIENCMCGSLTHTQPTKDMLAEPVNCILRSIDDSEVVSNEPIVVDLPMHSEESHAVGTLHNETEKLCSKEFYAKISERVDSENADIESDETAKILESTAEVEESLENCTRVQSDKIELHSINSGKEIVEDRKTQLETDLPTGQEREMSVTNNTSPAQMNEENVIHREDPLDKNLIELRGAAADDVTQMFTTEVSDHLEASIKDNELVADNESSPHSVDPSILEDSCLGTEEIRVDGEGSKVDSDSESVATVSYSLDPTFDNSVTETHVDAAQDLDGSPYINHTVASVTLKDLSDLGDGKKSVETRSINDSADTCKTEPQPAENGDSIVNFNRDADVSSETEVDNYDADVNRRLNGVVDGNSSENDGFIVNLSHDGVVKSEAEADNDHADVNKKFDGVLNANSSDMRSDFSICEVNGVINGVKELVNGTQTLSAQSDVSETVESGAVSVELNLKSQVSPMSSIDSSAIHAHLENEADNSQVDAGKQLKCVTDDPGTARKISLSTSEVSEISVPSCNGKDLHSPSDAADTPVMESKISLSTSEATEVRTPVCNGKYSHSPSELVDTPGTECKISISIPEASEVKTPVCYAEDLHSPSQVADTLGTECKISLSTSEASEVRASICNGEDPHSPSKVGDTPSTESKISLSTSEDSHVAPFSNGEDPHSPSEVAETAKGKSEISPSTSDVSEVCALLCNGKGPCSPSEVGRIEGTDYGDIDNSRQPLIETKISLLTSEVADAIAPCCNGEDPHSFSDVVDIPSMETKIRLSTSEGSEVSHLHSPSEVDNIKGPDNGAVVMSSQPAVNGVQLSNNHGVNQRIECDNGPVHIGTKSTTTIDNVEGLIVPSVEKAGDKLEIEAENGPLNAKELGTSHGSDDKEPESEMNMMAGQVVVHDATSESVADDVEVGLDGRRKGQLNDFTSGISFGSFTNGDIVGTLSIQVTDGACEGNDNLGDGGDELSESKSVEATSVATINSRKNDAASFESVERGPSNNDGEGSNELVCTNGAHAEVATLSPKISATDTVDRENMGAEDVKLPFYYLIKIPRHEDLELSNQKKLAEAEVEEMTRKRDDIQSECRKAQERWSELKRSVDAAIQEERDTRDQIRAKRKEIDSAQALVDIARDAMTIEDLDRKIADMEHKIQHETMPLREEKDLIREIKQSKQLREQLRLVSSKKQGVQQALDDKYKNKEHSKVLRKEIDALKERLSQLEQATKAARTKFDEETKKLNELRDERHSANAVRNQAFSNLVLLRKQWSEKAKYFYQYKENQTTAYQCAATGDKELLQQHCVNQVETMMTLWNTNDDFRRDYVRCNRLRILRNFGTSDGRALGVNEEPASVRVVDRVKVNASVKEAQVSNDATVYPPLVSKVKETDNRSLEKVVQRQNPDNQSFEKAVDGKNSKNNIVKANGSTPVKVDVAKASSLTVEIVEDQEALKLRREQEEVARKALELMKEEEAAKLKERLRQEEKEKAQQALERKRRLAEKAQAKAEAKAKKEAELKEKEREKKARKKEKKKAGNAEIPISKPETEAATRTEVSTDESTKEPDTQEQRSITAATTKRPARTQYTKQNKIIKSIAPPPPPLRNRCKRRMQQWMWVLVAVAAVIGLFFLGNGNFALIRELFDSFN